MKTLKNNRGQGLLLFAGSIGALMFVLIGTIVYSLSDLDKDVTALKMRVDSYQASIQISQVIQEAVNNGNRAGSTCVVTMPDGSPLNLTKMNVGGVVICVPTDGICTGAPTLPGKRFCVAQGSAGGSGGYSITKYEGALPKENFEVAEPSPSLWERLSPIPIAHAQVGKLLLRPPLGTVPSTSVGVMACDTTPASRCVICGTAAPATANCFKVKICLNNSTVCDDPGTFFNANVAVNFRKN